MTDGLHAEYADDGRSRSSTSTAAIDAAVADRWRESAGALLAESRELAARLGYELRAPIAGHRSGTPPASP